MVSMTDSFKHRQAAQETDALLRRRLQLEISRRNQAERRRALIRALRSAPLDQQELTPSVPMFTTKQDCLAHRPSAWPTARTAQTQGMTRTYEQVRDEHGVIHARKVTTLCHNGQTKTYTHDLIGPMGRMMQSHRLKGEANATTLTRYSSNTDSAAFEKAFKAGPFAAPEAPALPSVKLPKVLLRQIEQSSVNNSEKNEHKQRADMLKEIKQVHKKNKKELKNENAAPLPLPPIVKNEAKAVNECRPPTPPAAAEKSPSTSKATKEAMTVMGIKKSMPDDWMVPVEDFEFVK
jgi:hypothetical protein